MSTIPGPYEPYDAASPPPPPPPPPTWPDGNIGGPRRPRRRGLALAAAGTALALGAGGAAWTAVGPGGGPMTAAAIASQTDPGLVDVISTLGYQHATAEGTGMVLTSNGEVLTNNHVIAGATSVKVRDVGNGSTYTAKVVGYSDSNDVAVLQLTGASGLATVNLGSSSDIAAGQAVIAIGNAQGKDGTPSVVTGKITSLDNTISAEDDGDGAVEHLTGMIETNADIEPGDSGGPLLNTAGQVIGMDTAASTSQSDGASMTAAVSTTAFSIPINKALAIADQIEAGESSGTVHIGATAFLGVEVDSTASQFGFGQEAAGATVAGVLPGTAAADAGLAGGSTITSVGGHEVGSASQLQSVIELYHPGDKVSVSWTNEFGQTQTATVVLTAGPAG